MTLRTLACAFPFALALSAILPAQERAKTQPYTRADSVRGRNGPGRSWWDAQFYDLHVTVNPADSSIHGYNAITYKVLASPLTDAALATLMQIPPGP